MISIVHLITDLDVGGAETALLRVASRLDRTRFSCTVLSLTGPGALVPTLRNCGVETSTLSNRRSVSPATIWRLVRTMRRLRPAVLQTWLYHADLLGLVAGRLAGVPVIAWNVRCSNLEAEHHSRSLLWIRSALARFSRAPQAVVVNSQSGRDVHEKLGYRPQRWELIPNGFDMELFAPSAERRREVRRDLGIGDESPVIGHIARFHPMKDHNTFLAAMACVARTRPDVRIVMAGRGIDDGNADLRELLMEHGLRDRVTLLGETDQTARILAALDVAVSSSFYGEGFPNIVGEAMAAGVPVVATDAGDSARIIGRAGRIVPCRNPGALANAILWMIAQSPADRQALGLRGRDRIAREFALDTIVARYEQLYLELTRQAACNH